MSTENDLTHQVLTADRVDYTGIITRSCPFCNLPAPPNGDMDIGDYEDSFFVYCVGCFAQGPYGKTVQQAIDMWNQRTAWWADDEEVTS